MVTANSSNSFGITARKIKLRDKLKFQIMFVFAAVRRRGSQLAESALICQKYTTALFEQWIDNSWWYISEHAQEPLIHATGLERALASDDQWFLTILKDSQSST